MWFDRPPKDSSFSVDALRKRSNIVSNMVVWSSVEDIPAPTECLDQRVSKSVDHGFECGRLAVDLSPKPPINTQEIQSRLSELPHLLPDNINPRRRTERMHI